MLALFFCFSSLRIDCVCTPVDFLVMAGCVVWWQWVRCRILLYGPVS